MRLVCQPVSGKPLPFQTWILIYPGNYNRPATSCDGVAPAIYEFLFTVILLLAVNFEHLQRGITSTWSKLQVTPTEHVLLALLLNFGMGTAIVFLTTIEVPYTVSLWTKVLFNQHLKHSSAFWLFGEWFDFFKGVFFFFFKWWGGGEGLDKERKSAPLNPVKQYNTVISVLDTS